MKYVRHRTNFYIEGKNGRQIGEMICKVSEDSKVLRAVRIYIDPEMRSQGMGKALLEHAMEVFRREGYRIIPVCPFVSSQVITHPEKYSDLIAS